MWPDGSTRRGVLKGVTGGSLLSLAAKSVTAQADSIAVTITETNDPVETGAVLEVTAEIANAGDEPVGTNAILVVGHDPTVVDAEPVRIAVGETATVDLEFETAVVDNDQEFPIWVVADDAADRTSVYVYADAPPVSVTIRATNDPVTAGSVLEVVAELENGGSSRITEEVSLIVGHDPTLVDSTTVTIDPGDSETVRLEFETAAVDNDQEFPVRVETDADADERTVLVTASEPSVTIDIFRTNAPLAAGEFLEVQAQVRNTGDSTVTEELVLIVGHDPQQVDSTTVTLSPGTGQLVSLGYETYPAAQTTEFPVRVEGSDDAAERTVRVVGTDDDPVETAITFPSCTRAEVSGMFADGDTVAASTGFYDEANGDALYGNTRIEDWIDIGEHVDAPFSGTIVFEIGDGRSVSETADGAYVEVPDYGDLGTVLTGVTLPRDYATAGITETNPEAQSCLEEIERRAGDGDGGDGTDPGAVSVSITGTNDPVQAGAFLEVTAEIENTGDEAASQTVVLIVGHDPTRVDSTTVSLEGGERATVSLGYETYPAARTTTFPVRVESGDDADQRTVEVIGTEADSPADETDGKQAQTTETDGGGDADSDSEDDQTSANETVDTGTGDDETAQSSDEGTSGDASGTESATDERSDDGSSDEDADATADDGDTDATTGDGSPNATADGNNSDADG